MWVVDDVKNIKRCAVMGQHPLQFPWGFDEEDDGCIRIKIKLTQCITHFIAWVSGNIRSPVTPA